MEVIETAIPDVKLLVPTKHGDHRGFFSETYNKQMMLEAGIDLDFVQDNHSMSADRGVLRGLHYQSPPFGQDKLVRVTKGSVLDVAVDLRKSSPTYGQHITAELSAENWTQILVPIGFAHGFVTLEPDTEVIYKVTNYYAPDNDGGLLWSDPDVGVDWPIDKADLTLSDKDKVQPLLKDLPTIFE